MISTIISRRNASFLRARLTAAMTPSSVARIPSISEAACDLGASDVRAFWFVTLPLLAPALFSSFLIAFTISFDEFAIASFLAPPGSPTYPVVLYSSSRTPALLPEVIAIGSIVIVASLALVFFAEVARRTAERRLEARAQAPPLTAG